MARQKKNPFRDPLKVRTVKLTPAVELMLQTLSQDASDRLGWPVSHSAIVRALVRLANRQPPAWATSELHPLIEEEIAQGRVWGSKKRG